MAAPPNSKKTAKPGVKKAAKKIVLKTPATPAKPRSVTSKTKPAAVKKASPLRKVGSKVIKKTTGKKASAGGVVAAFDLEAFVKVKFSELEKTAHQKKVVPETSCFHKSILLHCRTSLVEQAALWRT